MIRFRTRITIIIHFVAKKMDHVKRVSKMLIIKQNQFIFRLNKNKVLIKPVFYVMKIYKVLRSTDF